MSTLADTDRDPLDLIAEEFAARVRKGETPAVSEYAAMHPTLADDLRDLLPAVAQIELMKRAQRTAPLGPDTDAAPKRLGDYRIVREIGRGGMGVVYEAVQESLGRRVALKVLPGSARRDPAKRARFLREAQAAARLHHTHIVPVFGVGEADGVPYYVMQYITGCGLHELIHSWKVDDDDRAVAPPGFPRPGQWKKIARLIRSAALAVQEAHDSGILHRDLKPGNLLLDPRGHVWVTDFGLAKLLDEDSLTPTGDVMGTVQYMAPESLRGKTDERSDVYGLGMTLYELCCRALPFEGTSPGEIIKQIGDRDPAGPRQFNPEIPRDLETVILKSIARDRRERYRSADAFADDLLAFAQDRPVTAKRLTVAGQAVRWAKRNPAVAGLLGVTAATFLAAALFGWGMYARAQAALETQKEQVKKTQEANLKLKDNLDMSFAAFEEVLEAVGKLTDAAGAGPGGRGFGGPGGPGGPREPREPRPPLDGGGRPPGGPNLPDPTVLLEGILKFYDRFAAKNETNSGLQFQAAKAYRRVGEIHNRLGRPEKSSAAFERAIGMLEALYAADAGTADVALELIVAYAHAPPAAGAVPFPKERVAALERMLPVAEKLRADRASDPHVLGPLGDLYRKLARAADAAGDRTAAEGYIQKANDLGLPPRPFPGGLMPQRRGGE